MRVFFEGEKKDCKLIPNPMIFLLLWDCHNRYFLSGLDMLKVMLVQFGHSWHNYCSLIHGWLPYMTKSHDLTQIF